MKKRYNDFKNHTVTRGETTQSICSRYGILESDLVQANPNIPLAKYGGGFFGSSTYKLDIKAGDNLKIPFYNEEKDKSGVKSIKGKSTVKVGVWENYEVAEWYAGTPPADRNEAKVKWNLYYLKNGAAPEKVLEKEEGKIRFQEKAAGNKYKVVGYVHEPELNNASAKLVSVEPAEKREILSIKLSDVNNKPINEPLAYGNYVNVHVETTGMKGEYLHISLWEDDANGTGHSDTNKHNLVSEGKVLVGNKGVAHKQFVLKADFKRIANAYLSKGDSDEGSTHEYYVTAYASGESKASPNINVRNPDYQEKRKTETQEHLGGNASTPQTENNTNRSTNPGVESTTTTTQIESAPITADATAVKVEVAESTTVAKVADSNTTVTAVEALVDAYFAKEEFKKETAEATGQHTYTFQSNNNNIDKDKVAGIIKKRVDEKIKSDKKYAKLDDIKNALTKTSYKKGDSISINLYKLGPEYVKINSAPLEEEVYVVAKTVALDGKEVIIKIKEKVSVILANDADLNVLEAKENGSEITTLKATAEKGIAKVKIKLRPKSDEELKTWKEKLKGIKDGTHTYTFGGDGNKTKTDEEKKKIAGIILKKVNESLSGQKKFAKAEDIQKALVNEVYNKGEQITFDVYKEITEYLWLKAECTGEVKKHEGEFLKRDGAYFEIGKGKCPRCEEEFTLKQIEDLFGVHSRSTNFREEVIKYLNQFIKQRKGTDKPIHLNTCLRKAHFFAQIGAETSGINTDWIIETDVIPYAESNINTALFGERSTNLIARGDLKAFCAERPQKKLLSYLYASENGFGNGNGDEASGDGYKFRGRGLKQLTGRGNYKDASEVLKEIFPDEYIDLEVNPDRVKEAKYAVLSALAYWEKHEIWKTADTIKESKDEDIKKIRRKVNGGTAGWKSAKGYFEKGIEVFKVNQCSPTNLTKGEWHDPVDNPMLCLYTQNGNYRPRYNVFGNVRKERSNIKHQGVDFLALPGSNVYACVDSDIEFTSTQEGYGKVVCLKVKDKETFLSKKREFSLVYSDEGEILEGNDFNYDGDFYLFYAHLQEIKISDSGEVKAGKIIGLNGTSGYGSTKDPHLHFEIRNKATASGLNNRCHPGIFVHYKGESDMTQEEKDYHEETAKTNWD